MTSLPSSRSTSRPSGERLLLSAAPPIRAHEALALLLTVQEPMQHHLRTQLLDIVSKYPGLHLREISRMVELPPSHAQYHLRVLERHGLVKSLRQEENVRFYTTQETPVGELPVIGSRERDLLHFLRRPAVLQILVTLLDRPSLTLSELARACGVAPSTMHYHLDRLRAKDLIVRIDDPENSRWSLRDAAEVRSLLVRHEPPPPLAEGFLDVWSRLTP